MNDISVKIVDSPKELVVDSPSVAKSVDSDVDPLAIDVESGQTDEEQTPVVEKAGTCDENAKDENEFGTGSEDSNKLIDHQPEDTANNLAKETSVANDKVDVIQTAKSPNNEENPRILELDADAPTPDLDTTPEDLEDLEQVEKVPDRSTETSKLEFREKETSPLNEVLPESIKGDPIKISESTKPELVKSPEIEKIEGIKVQELTQVKTLELSNSQEVKTTEQTKESDLVKSQEVAQVPQTVTSEVVKTPTSTSPEVQAPQTVKLPEVVQIPEVARLSGRVKSPDVVQIPEIKAQETVHVQEVTKVPEIIKALEASKVVKVPEVLKVPEVKPKEILQETSKIQTLVKQEVMPMALDLPKVEHFVSKTEKKGKQEKVESTDVEMVEIPPNGDKKSTTTSVLTDKPKIDEKVDVKEKSMPVNGDIAKEDQSSKRRASADIDTESPLKKLCLEVENTFPQHDSMINDYIQTATKNNIDEIQRHTEQLLAEIQTLRELAQKKEHEWNNILHLKKVKEEILLRLLRRKQVLSFEKSVEVNGAERPDHFDFLNQAKNLAIDKSDEISGLAIKQPGSSMSPMVQPVMPVTTHFNPMVGLPPPYDKAAHMQNMPKPVFQPMMLPGPMPGFPRDMNGQLPSSFGMPMGRQGPTKDVKSIIADYRQRNPDVTPRRGRRMKSLLNPNMMNAPRPIAPKMDSMNSLNNLNMLFNNLDMNQKAMLERLQQMQAGNLPNSIFKDALVQFANMQQATNIIQHNPTSSNRVETVTNRDHKERRPSRPLHGVEEHKQPERPTSSPRLPPPPPYPEISLLPVSTGQETSQTQQQNSLLHGILTKHAPGQSYSPTLAKLLTSPERQQALPAFGQAKNCGEITITPVQPTPPPEPQQEKSEDVVQLDDEESAASEGEASGSPLGSGSGRLVIDEGSAEATETPLCQGCRRRDAQFVCAGCANQWYCSRDCQVAAWDEHSEMCSG